MNLRTRRPIEAGALAATLAVACTTAFAGPEEDVARLAQPESSASIGIGVLDRDSARFGQYSGIREGSAYGLVDLSLVRRDDATGTWIRLLGRNIGLDTRELRFEHERQGNWGYSVEYSETPRYSPYTVNTAVQGIGSAQLFIPYPAATSAKGDVQLKTERESWTVGLKKILPAGWDVQVRFRSEEKDGSRLFSRGTTGGTGGYEFLPEPIDYRIQQLDATLAYADKNLQLTGGYYGVWFRNRNAALTVANQPGGPSSLGTGAGAFTPIGLPPGSDSHQLHLAGGYNFTPTTRLMFKAAYGRRTQEDTFIVAPSAFVPRSDLGGRIDTTQLQLGLSSRPLPQLSLRADLRYEDRDDKTPVYPYLTFNPTTLLTAANSPTSTVDGLNEPRSIRTTVGKLEASYALPMGFRLNGGVDVEQKKRNTSAVRVVSHRDETSETAYRAELRRSLSETVNGTLSYANSRRTGSDWLLTTRLDGTAGSNLVAPLHLADRDRDKWRAVIDWSPLPRFSLQFSLDDSRDEYSGRALGPRRGKSSLYALDAAYSFGEQWQFSAWVSRSDTRAEQATCEAASSVGVCPSTAADPVWQASLRNAGDAIGLGLRGRPSEAFELGADLQYGKDRTQYRQDPLPVPAVAGTPLPDVNYDRITLRVFLKYALQKNAGVRLLYTYDRFSTDDFTWANWQYTDGTRVLQSPTQKANFFGLSYYFDFR